MISSAKVTVSLALNLGFQKAALLNIPGNCVAKNSIKLFLKMFTGMSTVAFLAEL